MVAVKHAALANELRKEILSGRYGSEGGLPVVSEIARNHSMAINTVKVALSRLEGEGLIVNRAGNFYVNGLQIVMTQHVPLPEARLHNRVGYVKTLRVTRDALPDYVRAKLHLPPDKHIVLTRDQVSGEVNGVERPLQLTTRYYFLSLAGDQISRLEQESAYDPMWELTSTLQSRDEISSRPATEQEAAQLKLPDGTSVIAVFEVIRDANGALLMAQEITLSPRDTLIFEFSFENKP